MQSDWRKVLGNAFIAIGLLLLLGAGGVYGWEQWQGQQLRNELLAEPTTEAIAMVGSPTTVGTPTPLVTTAPTQLQTATALPTETPARTNTQAPATVMATPSPTQAPTPTGVPPTKPVRIHIPDLKIDIPVTDMTWKVANGSTSEWEIPEYAAGHAVNSALLGEPGNVVLSGHNNIFGRVFMRISQAWPETGVTKLDAYTDQASILDGRRIILIGADGRTFEYIITAFYRVKDSGVPADQRLKNGEYMAPTEDTRLTVTTCWPPWSNTHRLIVIAKPAS